MAYNAFISYSHTADGTLAPALQSALHRFAKPWYKLRALHIFRDQTNLAVNPALWSSIREALDDSQFFILLASPEAAASPWVGKEAEYWIANNGLSHFLIVLTGGDLQWDRSGNCFAPEANCALPPNLLHSFPEEPLYLDLRWARGAARLKLREPRFHEAVLQLASTLRHRPKDELDSADIRFQRHTRWLAAGVCLALLAAVFIATRQTGRTYKEIQKNVADALAARSAKVLADNPDRAREAALLAIESDRLNPSFESNQALRTAVALLPAGAQFYPPDDPSPDARVRDLKFSPDGTKLAVDRDNGSTQLIDVTTHKSLAYFGPDDHPAAQIDIPVASPSASSDNNAVSAAFNSTGALLASGSRDGLVHIWATNGARELLRILHHAPVSQVAFHPKTNQLVTATEDGHVRLFDADHASLLADFQCPGKIGAASFSPAGDVVAALSEGEVSLFDTASRKPLRTMPSGTAPWTLSFSKDGKRLAAATGEFAYVWDVAGGQQLFKATHAATSETLTPSQWIVSAAISPDGKFMAYAAKGDKLARVWNADTGRLMLELKHDSAVADVTFNADGTQLGTGSYDGTARVWELPAGREIDRISHGGGGSEIVIFGPGGDRFASSGMDGSVAVSEARRADRPASFDLPDESRSVAFSPDGHRFAIGTRSVHYSPLVKIVETGGKILREIEFHGAPSIDKLFFLNPNEVVAQWSEKLFLIAVDRSSVILLPEIRGEKRIEPSGNVFAIQEDGVSRLYTVPGLQQTASLEGPSSSAPEGPRSILLRPTDHGKQLVFETDDPPREFFIDIWSVNSKSRVSRVRLPADLNHMALNPSGTILFTTQGENVQGWDIPSARRRFAIKASDDVNLIIPNPTSTSFATTTHGQVTVWDSVTGARLAQLPDAGYVYSAAFSPDGRYLLAGYNEHSAALWLWRTADLRDQACARIAHSFSHEEWLRWIPEQPYRLTCPKSPPAK